ncbi:MAG: UDP-N-acetylmuramoyl-tripeptide--D-alanyl-D-alanine ligase [Eggerthellaceae bacterium]|nr:UDP-N-acetylmuramoyl-tripeptide--D-alanyl-D-alanine ligase [Eggerthellaceae bacterium]
MRLSLSEIALAVNAAQPKEAEDPVTGITWDSREVKSGDLYVALPGERVDGHDFAAAAVAAGAAAVMVQKPVEVDAPVVLVDSTAQALVDLATYWRGRLAGTVIGLTGSTGKTTTKNLVRDVLASAGSVVATIANQNNELGVPRTLLAAEADTNAVVVEMGMRGSGQIAELCAYAKPDWGLITNVGESHIELLGSRDAIAYAKDELFESLPDDRGIAFVNAADDYAVELVRHARLAERGVRCVFFEGGNAWKHADELGIFEEKQPFVWASDVFLDAEGRPLFIMHAENFESIGMPEANGVMRCMLELRGIHNVSNACSAAAVGLAVGMTLEQCCEALSASQPEQGRQQVHRCENGLLVVDDSYNANPDSMSASLATFATMDIAGRRIAVLGDMLELGKFAQEAHEEIGFKAASSNLDMLVCVGDLGRYIASSACRAGMPADAVKTCADAQEALDLLVDIVAPQDAVLVKASHSIGLNLVAKGLVD